MSDEGLTRAQVEILKQLTDDVERLTADRERLMAWVADLQSGMFVNCVYCGHNYGPGETTPVSMADALKAHIRDCPEHPMQKADKLLKAAYHGLRSYEHDNGSPYLAREICEAMLKFGLKP